MLSEVDGITINNVASHLGTGFKVTIVMMWQLERVRTMFKELRRWFRDGGVYRLVECGVDSKIVDVIERAMAGRSRNTGMRESDKSRVSDRSQSKGKPTANSQNT